MAPIMDIPNEFQLSEDQRARIAEKMKKGEFSFFSPLFILCMGVSVVLAIIGIYNKKKEVWIFGCIWFGVFILYRIVYWIVYRASTTMKEDFRRLLGEEYIGSYSLGSPFRILYTRYEFRRALIGMLWFFIAIVIAVLISVGLVAFMIKYILNSKDNTGDHSVEQFIVVWCGATFVAILAFFYAWVFIIYRRYRSYDTLYHSFILGRGSYYFQGDLITFATREEDVNRQRNRLLKGAEMIEKKDPNGLSIPMLQLKFKKGKKENSFSKIKIPVPGEMINFVEGWINMIPNINGNTNGNEVTPIYSTTPPPYV